MGGLKPPDPYGLHALFFQSQWLAIGDSVCELVFEIFHNPHKIKDIDQTFISLTSEVESPELVKHLHPISLCNIVYKVVTKIIANRLRRILPTVITPTQCGFIHNRSSSHNVIVAQEVIHKMRNAKGEKRLHDY